MPLGGLPFPPPPPDAAARAGESNLTYLVTVPTIFGVVSLVTVGLRMYVRLVMMKKKTWEDFVMVATMVTSLAALISFYVQTQFGLGKHYWTMSDEDGRNFLQASFLQANIGLIPGLSLLKISIGLSLLRIGTGSRWYIWVMYGLLVFVVISWLFGSFTIIFFCNPVPRYWDGRVDGTCYPIPRFVNFGVAHTAANIFTDVAFATLPIPIIWALQMKRRTRAYLIGVFSLGYIAVAMGIVRAVFQIGFGKNPDSQFTQNVQFWGFLQLNCGIIASCLPTLKPLFKRVLKLSSAGYSSNMRYGQSGTDPTGRSTRRRTGYIEQRTPVGGDYEMDPYNGAKDRGTNVSTTVRGGGSYGDKDSGKVGGTFVDLTGSEESILGDDHRTKGITKTTEVYIQR